MTPKKIAFVAGWYLQQGNTVLHPDNLFIFNCLFKTAKKNFLPNHEVDFIFITNGDIEVPDVKTIKINYEVPGFWHACLMKLLSLNYIEENYDYIFVSDYDQIFVNEVTDDILHDDMVILQHFFKPTASSIHREVTTSVDLNFDTENEHWTMGNFFGGKGDVMKSLGKQVEQWHNFYKRDSYSNNSHFYTTYPEEIFLLKYIFENNIQHRRLITTVNPDEFSSEELFLGDFKEKIEIYSEKLSVKVLHNTKKNLDQLKNVINNYI